MAHTNVTAQNYGTNLQKKKNTHGTEKDSTKWTHQAAIYIQYKINQLKKS